MFTVDDAVRTVLVPLVVAPLAPQTVPRATHLGTALALAAGGAGLCYAARVVEQRVGGRALVAGLCVVTGGAGVVVLCSSWFTGGL